MTQLLLFFFLFPCLTKATDLVQVEVEVEGLCTRIGICPTNYQYHVDHYQERTQSFFQLTHQHEDQTVISHYYHHNLLNLLYPELLIQYLLNLLRFDPSFRHSHDPLRIDHALTQIKIGQEIRVQEAIDRSKEYIVHRVFSHVKNHTLDWLTHTFDESTANYRSLAVQYCKRKTSNIKFRPWTIICATFHAATEDRNILLRLQDEETDIEHLIDSNREEDIIVTKFQEYLKFLAKTNEEQQGMINTVRTNLDDYEDFQQEMKNCVYEMWRMMHSNAKEVIEKKRKTKQKQWSSIVSQFASKEAEKAAAVAAGDGMMNVLYEIKYIIGLVVAIPLIRLLKCPRSRSRPTRKPPVGRKMIEAVDGALVFLWRGNKYPDL